MAWTAITENDLLDEFSAPERTAHDNVKNSDALGNILRRVINRFRGAILAGGGTLGDDGTLPDSLHGEAIALARWRYLLSLPNIGTAIQSEPRKEEAERAVALLKRIEAGEYRVEDAATAGDVQSMVPMPSTGDTRTDFSRDNQDGL